MLNREIRASILAITLMVSQPLSAQPAPAPILAHIATDQPGPVINRDIFGQFAEMLGGGIYGGVWVGRDSPIANVRGIRSDVVAALKAIQVPVVRWPGGCFADGYDWHNGVGPVNRRPATLNAAWGGVVETNSFGTDEFMDFAHQIGAEAYLSVNVGSGTPQQAGAWLEYLTGDKPSALVKERIANGHPQPYKVKYLGIGNESWGCGGAMTPEAYIDRLKLFTLYTHNYNPAQQGASMSDVLTAMSEGKLNMAMLETPPQGMQRVAVGPDGAKTEYTEAVMKAWHDRGGNATFWGFEGLSMHFYTTGGGFPFSYASSNFGEKQYATLLKETLGMEQLIATHSAIMDKYDSQKKVSLNIDEWGAWLKPIAGTNPIFLKQQNTLRDAILASLNLNIFARHADRVRMTNIAQMVNVIQSMILTDGPKMVLTPTYYVYKMYVPFQNATLIPVKISPGTYSFGDVSMPQVDMIAARAADGAIWLAMTNVDPARSATVAAAVDGVNATLANGEVLTAPKVDSLNDFGVPAAVVPVAYHAAVSKGKLWFQLPPKSVTVVKLQ